MKSRICAFLLILLALSASANHVGAVAIPLLDPGLDLYQANTLVSVPDNVGLNIGTPGAGTGPLEDAPLVSFVTFGSAGLGDIPAGWTATGNRPNNSNNTSRVRLDSGFDVPLTGVVAVINSFGSDSFPPAPGTFKQSLPGVAILANTLYTATIQVMDLDITKIPSFGATVDNFFPGKRERIKLSLSAGGVDLGGVLEFSDITPGGLYTPDGSQISGGKSLLTLTVLTGATVPAGDLTISFTAAGGSTDADNSFGATSQTLFDNVTLDATPFAAPGVPGDYNNNGVVDAGDYVLWRKGGPLQNQVDDPNTINAQDYTEWRKRFGNVTGSGTALGSVSVPEPFGMFTLLMGGLLALGWIRLQSRTKAAKFRPRSGRGC
jgi:hypothetical protein